MASPAQLVQTVSSATGVPLATIVDIDRKLATAKLRSKGGRGFNAARMTPLDAARLLVAVLGSPQANTAAEAVRRYSLTAADKDRSSENLFCAARIDDLAALPPRHSFVEAVAALIASTATGSLAGMVSAAEGPTIEVFAFARATRGRIRIAGLPNGVTASVEYVPAVSGAKVVPSKKIGRQRKAPIDNGTGDLEQSRRITKQTILLIARLLARDEQHEPNDRI